MPLNTRKFVYLIYGGSGRDMKRDFMGIEKRGLFTKQVQDGGA